MGRLGSGNARFLRFREMYMYVEMSVPETMGGKIMFK